RAGEVEAARGGSDLWGEDLGVAGGGRGRLGVVARHVRDRAATGGGDGGEVGGRAGLQTHRVTAVDGGRQRGVDGLDDAGGLEQPQLHGAVADGPGAAGAAGELHVEELDDQLAVGGAADGLEVDLAVAADAEVVPIGGDLGRVGDRVEVVGEAGAADWSAEPDEAVAVGPEAGEAHAVEPEVEADGPDEGVVVVGAGGDDGRGARR